MVNQATWIIHINCSTTSLYTNEVHRLRVEFSPEYPIDSPEVKFIPPAPMHPKKTRFMYHDDTV